MQAKEELYQQKSSEHRQKLEEAKRQEKKFEDKIKDLTNQTNTEKQKRADEVKQLRNRIKSLNEEVTNAKTQNYVSEEEIKMRADSMIQDMVREVEEKLIKEKQKMQVEIDGLKDKLDSERKQMSDRLKEFEAEKSNLTQQVKDDDRSKLIQGKYCRQI